ncbi:MAG: glycosyltransferase family 2 protein [archaeon]
MKAKKDAMKRKMVSIIILNWNGLGFTKKCLASIKSNTSGQDYEIIVVDNGSDAKEVQELKKMHAKKAIGKLILNAGNRGFSGGNNQGLKIAEGDYLLLLNNDTTLTKNWLSELVKTAEEDPKIGVVGPNIELAYNPGVAYGGGYVDDSGTARNFDYSEKERDAEQVGGAALFFKRAVLEKIGGLDEGFNPIYFEETDFCARARKAGFRVVFTPKSKIIHFEGGIMKKQPGKRTFVSINKNRVRYMLLHFPPAMLAKAVPFELGRVAKGIATMRIHWLLEAYAIDLKNLGEIMEKRKRIKKGDLKA